MSDETGKLIERMRAAAHGASIKLNLAAARRAAEQQRLQAWLELLIDRLRSEGISEGSPLGIAIVVKALAGKLEQGEGSYPYDEEGFPRGGGDQ